MKRLPVTDPRETPAYSIPEAAGCLCLPAATLRSWVLGRNYDTAQGTKKFKPLIAIADDKRRVLSFSNLVEAHVLSSMRRDHGVSLHNVRKSLDYVAQNFESARPLIDQQFETDGVNLFVERYGQLVNVSMAGQVAMRELIKQYLRRIDRDKNGLPIKLYPFTRPSENLQQPQLVQIDPQVSFGRPVLTGTGIRTEIVFERFLAGEKPADLANDYGRPEEEIDEALRYEYGLLAA